LLSFYHNRSGLRGEGR